MTSAIENAEEGDTIALGSDTYTISGNDTTGLIFCGNGDSEIEIDGNIQNVIVKNATVTGSNSLNVKAGNSATFENVTFEGNVGNVSQGVVKGDMTFIGCTFEAGFHIDKSEADTNVTFEDCTFTEDAYIKLGGSANYQLTDCTVETLASGATGPWGKQWLISYSDIYLENCDLGRVIRAGAAITITLDNCTFNGAAATSDAVHTYNSPNVVVK